MSSGNLFSSAKDVKTVAAPPPADIGWAFGEEEAPEKLPKKTAASQQPAAAKKSKVLADYSVFKANLRGWTAVGLSEFRETIVPLKEKKVWELEEKKRLAALGREGAGHALHAFMGPAARDRLRECGVLPSAEPQTKAEFEDAMLAFLKGCRRAGWTAAMYREYLDLLEGRSVSANPQLAEAMKPWVLRFHAGSEVYRASLQAMILAAIEK